MGKGYSITKGIIKSKGSLILITDADLSAPIDEFLKLKQYIGPKYNFVIGSRGKKDSKIRIKQNIIRIIMGETFNLFVRKILKLDYKDTQCGFKLFQGDKVRDIINSCRVNGFCIDVEILFLAKKYNISVYEKGITWNNDSRSSVNLISDPLSMFIDLIKIRFRKY